MNLTATLLKTLLVFTLLGLSACTDPEDLQSTQPEALISETPFSPSLQDWPHSTSDIPPDPKVSYGRLENGLRYAILPERDDTGTVSIQLNISAGWNDEPDDAYGVAHLLEHIAFRSKREDGDTSIIHDLQSNGVGFGRDFNGFTTDENTYYLINLTTPNTKDVSNALTGFRGLIEASALSPETLTVEKKIVLAELNRGDAVQQRARLSYLAFENPKTARARVSGIGTEESLEGISLQQVQQFHDTHYRPEKSLIIIVGDIDLDGARKLIKSEFSDWERGAPETLKGVGSLTEGSETLTEPVSFREPKAKTELRAIQQMPSTVANDLMSKRRHRFIDRMVISTFRDRLNVRVEGEPKVNWMTPFKTQNASHDTKGVKMGAKDYEIGYTVFEEERRRLIKYGLTDEEFTFAFNKKRANFRRAAEPGKLISAPSAASKMRRNFINGDVYNNPQQELAIFETFEASITKDDLEQSAKKMWTDFTPKYWTQSSRLMDGTIKRVMAVRGAIKEDEVEGPSQGTDTVFKSAFFSDIGTLKSRDSIKAEDTHRLLFENGTRLNFKTSDEKKNEIIVAISLKPQDDNFLKHYSAISEKLPSLSWADIAGTDKLTMERQFVGKKAAFSVSVFEDRLLLLISTTPDDLQESLEIASTFLVSFDLESEDHTRSFTKRLRRQQSSVNASPVQTGSIKLSTTYADDPSAFRSELNRGSFIRENRDAEIKKIIETGSIEVGVVGDFDDDIVINTFAKTIGAMPAREPVRLGRPYTDPSITHNSPRVETLTYAGSADQMALQYCWPLRVDLTPNERVESDIFSQIVLNRLQEHLREELGLTYAMQALGLSNRVFPNFGYKCFSAQIDPKNEEVTLVGFEAVVSKLHDAPITKSEFNRAKNPLISYAERYISNNYLQALLVARAYSDESYWERLKGGLKALETVSLKSARASTKDFFKPSELSIFRVQQFQSSRLTRKNTLLAKNYLGDADAQLELGKSLLWNSTDTEKEEGVAFLKKAAASGLSEAHLELGKFYGRKNKFKIASTHLEKAEDVPEAAFLLSLAYFDNFKLFPDISDERVIELAKRSAEGGFVQGQFFFADRLKDGTFTERDEVAALKWALIANYSQRGELKLSKVKHIERFQTGVKQEDIAVATEDAKAWIKDNPK